MSQFVDFKAVKAAVSMFQVLENYGIAGSFKRSGNSLSRLCPLDGGDIRTRFRVSVKKNNWNCFNPCRGGGNVLDCVVRNEGCSLREAALAMCGWFQSPTPEKLPMPSKHMGEPTKKDEPLNSEPGSSPTKAKASISEESGPNKSLGFARQNLDTTHQYIAEPGWSAETTAELLLDYCHKSSMTGHIVVVVMLDEDDSGRCGREKTMSQLAICCALKAYSFEEEDPQSNSLTTKQLEAWEVL